jgi:excisionase family DNA binding protein
MENLEVKTLQIEGITAETLLSKFEAIQAQISELREKDKPNPLQENKLITRKETARILGVSLVTLHSWVNKNILKAYRIGNKVRFKENEVLESLQEINPKKQ